MQDSGAAQVGKDVKSNDPIYFICPDNEIPAGKKPEYFKCRREYESAQLSFVALLNEGLSLEYQQKLMGKPEYVVALSDGKAREVYNMIVALHNGNFNVNDSSVRIAKVMRGMINSRLDNEIITPISLYHTVKSCLI
jgi:hypothetical protein